MRTEEEIRHTIASNLSFYRKMNNMTQSQVAELLSYSDKAISKWERGEAAPDIYILTAFAEIYHITLNDLLAEKKLKKIPSSKRNHIVITSLSVGLCWLIATIAFVLLLWIGNGSSWLSIWSYMPYIYAIPSSFIVALVFNKIWGKRKWSVFLVSGIIWGVGLSLERSLFSYLEGAWLFYIICIPIEILALLWYLIIRKGNSKYTQG
jgi:transcriptional regulator with XRE-family HTH domain